MEERILARSSENISKLLNLMLTHEYNVKNYMRNNRAIDIQLIFDRISLDISNQIIDVSNVDVSNIDISNERITNTIFSELENRNEMICPITQEPFNQEDSVVLLDCGHYFKKEGFLVWARRSRSCPSCRAYFR